MVAAASAVHLEPSSAVSHKWLIAQIVLDRGQRADWFNTPWIVYAASLSALSFVLLGLREVSFVEPILDLRIFKQQAFDVAIVLQVAMSFILFGTILLSPLFLQELMGYSAWKAGLTLTPRGLAAMLALLLMGQLSRTGINTRPLLGSASRSLPSVVG